MPYTKQDTQAWRDQQADAIDRSATIECSDEQCNQTTDANDADKWLLHNDPDIPVLCPACREKVPANKQTPTERQRNIHAQLTEWSG